MTDKCAAKISKLPCGAYESLLYVLKTEILFPVINVLAVKAPYVPNIKNPAVKRGFTKSTN